MEAFRMTAMAFGNVIAQAVYVAARLGIADLLEAGPKSVEELARATGAHAPSLARLLRALASFDVFVEEETTGRYALNPLGATLLSARPGSVRDAVLMAGDALFNRPCGEMTQSVVTGEPAFERVFGARFFDYLARHPEAAAILDAVLRPGNEPDPSKVSDLLMMIPCPGRERTETEFAAVYAAAGLRLTRVVPTPTPLAIVEGAPA